MKRLTAKNVETKKILNLHCKVINEAFPTRRTFQEIVNGSLECLVALVGTLIDKVQEKRPRLAVILFALVEMFIEGQSAVQLGTDTIIFCNEIYLNMKIKIKTR